MTLWTIQNQFNAEINEENHKSGEKKSYVKNFAALLAFLFDKVKHKKISLYAVIEKKVRILHRDLAFEENEDGSATSSLMVDLIIGDQEFL